MERAGHAGLLRALLLITCEMKVNHLTPAYVRFLLYKCSVLLLRPSVKGKYLTSASNQRKTANVHLDSLIPEKKTFAW